MSSLKRDKHEEEVERRLSAQRKAESTPTLKPKAPTLGPSSGNKSRGSGQTAAASPAPQAKAPAQESGNLAESMKQSAIHPETQAPQTLPPTQRIQKPESLTAYGERNARLQEKGIQFNDVVDSSRKMTTEEKKRRDEMDGQMARVNGQYDARLDFSDFPDTDEGRFRAKLAAEDMTPESSASFRRHLDIYHKTGLDPDALYDERGGYNWARIDTLDKYAAVRHGLSAQEQKDFDTKWKAEHYLAGTGVSMDEYYRISAKTKKRSNESAWLKEVNKYIDGAYEADVNQRGLEKIALYAPDGSRLDAKNASFTEIVAAVRRIPDTSERAYATKLLKALSKNEHSGKYAGMVADDQEFDFMPPAEMANLADGEWNKIVKSWSAEFFAGGGHDEDNALAYADIWNEINGEGSEYTPLERAVLNDELNRQFTAQTGLSGTPNKEAMLEYGRRVREAEAAEKAAKLAAEAADEAGEEAAQEPQEAKRGIWEGIKAGAGGAARFLFGDDFGKAKDAPEEDELPEARSEAPEEAPGEGEREAGESAAGGEAQAVPEEAAQEEGAVIAGGTAIKGATRVAGAGGVSGVLSGEPTQSAEEVQKTMDAIAHQKELNATQPPMSEQELFDYYRAGGDLAELSADNREAFLSFFGGDAMDFLNPGAARQTNAEQKVNAIRDFDEWNAERKAYEEAVGIVPLEESFQGDENALVSVYKGAERYVARYGRLGWLGQTILSGEYRPIESEAMLAAFGIVREIDRRVAGNELTIPPEISGQKGFNVYDYALSQDAALADQVAALEGSLDAMKQAAFEGAQQADAEQRKSIHEAQKRAILGKQTPQDEALLSMYAEHAAVDNERSPIQKNMRSLLSGGTGFGAEADFFSVWESDYRDRFYAVSAIQLYGNQALTDDEKDAVWAKTYDTATLFNARVGSMIGRIGEQAASIGMTTDDYLAECGVLKEGMSDEERAQAAFRYATEMTYIEAMREGGDILHDEEAQKALDEMTRIGVIPVIGYGAEAAVRNYAYRFTDAIYQKIELSEYGQRRYELMNAYKEQYGLNAPARYVADIMTLLDSGALGEESGAALRANLAYAIAGGNVFDLAYDPNENNILREFSVSQEKKVDELRALVANAPEYERKIFETVSSMTQSTVGMGVRAVGMAALGAVGATGWAANFIATGLGFGFTTYSEAYNDGLIKGLGQQAAAWRAKLMELNTIVTNMGSTENEMNVFRDAGAQALKEVIDQGGWDGAVTLGRFLAKRMGEEGFEEATETAGSTLVDLFLPVWEKAAQGWNVTASDYADALVSGAKNMDTEAFVRDLADSAGAGAMQSLLFTLAGGVKSYASAKKTMRFDSARSAYRILSGKAPVSYESIGECMSALENDLQNPKFRKWLNGRAEEAQTLRCMAVSYDTDVGSEYRRNAYREGLAVAEWTEKLGNADAAMRAAGATLDEARAAAINGDAKAAEALTGLVNDYQKAATAYREAENALSKHKAAGQEVFSDWMREVRENGEKLSAELSRLRNEGLAAKAEEAAARKAESEANAEQEAAQETAESAQEATREAAEANPTESAETAREAAQEAEEGTPLTEAEIEAEVDAYIRERAPGMSGEQREILLERFRERARQDAERRQATRERSENAFQMPDRPKADAQAAQPIDREFVAQAAEKYGVNVEITEEDVPYRGKYDEKTGTITLSDKLTRGEATQEVLLHELTHSIEGTREYDEISAALLHAKFSGESAESDYQNAVNSKREAYARSGITLTEEQARGEIVADLTREILYADESAIRRFADKNPGVAERILTAIRNFIAKIKGERSYEDEQLDALRRKFERALEKAGKENAPQGGVKFSIAEDERGRYVQVDTDQDIFDGLTDTEALAAARDYILEHYRNQYVGEGPARAHITRATADKYAHTASRRSQGEDISKAKARAVTELPNLINVSEFIEHSEDDGRHKEAVNGWDYYQTRFRIGDREFLAKFNLIKGNGYQRLYDITKIENAGRVRGLSDQSQNAPSIPADSVYAKADPFVNAKTQKNEKYSLPTDEDADFIAFLRERGITENGIRKAVRQPGQKESQFAAKTGQKTPALTDSAKQVLRDDPFYQTTSQKANVERAMRMIEERGYESRRNTLFSERNALMTPQGQAEAYVLAKMAGEAGLAEDEAAIAMLVKESGTQIAQSMAMRKLWLDATPDGKTAYVQKTIDKINADYEKRGKDTRVEMPLGLRERIAAAMGDEDRMDEVIHQAWRDIAAQMPPDWRTRINGWRYMAMLTNPRTHIRNIAGNAVFMPAIAIKNKVGAALEMMVGTQERTKTLGVVGREYREFARSKLAEVHDTLTGGGKLSPMSEIAQARRTFDSDILEWISGKNGEALEAEDALFLNRHFENALAGYLQANKADLQNIDGALLARAMDYAITEAQKATYRDASQLADSINRFSQQAGIAGILIEGTVPFKKTPVNVVKRGVEYSPVGLIGTLTKGSYQLARGQITANQYIDSLASGLTGTALAALGAFAYAQGWARGRDKDKRDELEALTGGQEYALQIGGMTYTVDWMAPSAVPFFVGVEFSRMMGEDGFTLPAIYDALIGVTEPVFNLTMLDGINRALSSYNDNTVTDVMLTAAESYAGQFVPTVLGAMARTVDPTRRKTYVEGETTAEKTLSRMLGSIRSKIPGLSQGNIPYRNAWGEAETEDNAFLRAVQNFISPGYWKETEMDDVEAGLFELFDATQEPGLVPKMPNKYLTAEGERINLTAKQYDQITKRRGETAHQMLGTLFKSEAYQNADDVSRVSAVEDVWKYATKTASREIAPGVKLDKWMDTKNPDKAVAERLTKRVSDGRASGYKEAISQCVDSGDFTDIPTYIEGLRQEGKSDSSIRSSLTSAYKPEYIRAYQDGDAEAMTRIRSALLAAGVGYKRSTFKTWLE